MGRPARAAPLPSGGPRPRRPHFPGCRTAERATRCPTKGVEQGEGQVELTVEATSDLAELGARLEAAGVQIDTTTTDEGFGRQLVVRGPDGLPVKINELDQETYT